MGKNEDEAAAYACVACGREVEATTRPDECPECGGEVQNV